MAFGDNPNDTALRDGCSPSATDQAGGRPCLQGRERGERRRADQRLPLPDPEPEPAFDIFLENRDDRYPQPPRSAGLPESSRDNPDCIYLQSWINDHDTYKVSGNRGTAKCSTFAVQAAWTGSLQEPFGDTPVDNIFGEELSTDRNGQFTLWVSPEPHPGNWIESRPGAARSSTAVFRPLGRDPGDLPD